MVAKLYKAKELEESAHRAWDWLRALSEYRKAYREHKKKVDKNEACAFFFTSSAHFGEYEETEKEYKKRLKNVADTLRISRKEAISIVKYQDRILKVWGFYPPQDPKKKVPSALIDGFKRIFSQDTETVKDITILMDLLAEEDDPKNIKYSQMWIAEAMDIQKKASAKMALIIDASQSEGAIFKELRIKIKRFKQFYELKNIRPQADRLDLIYKAGVLKKLGMTSFKKYSGEFFQNMNSRNQESLRKKFEYLLKKSF